MDATTSPTPAGDGDHDGDDNIGQFITIRSAGSGELRGIAFAPRDHDFDDDHFSWWAW